VIPQQLPEEKLRLPNVGKLVAVASGKGGVGKSTIAMNLAVGLAQQGLRVGLLDADVHGPNVPLMLGVRRREAARGWQAVVPIGQNPAVPNGQRLPALERHGVKMMSVGLLVGEEQAAMLHNVQTVGWLVRNMLTLVEWGELDVLLIDFPPGTSEPQATLIATVELDGCVIVVTPQDLALLDSTRALRAFQEAGVPITGVVENMSYLRCPHCGEPIQIFHRSQVPRPITSGEIPLLAEIPLDPALSEAADTGRPLLITTPDSPQSRALTALARTVAERLGL
jgi:ATP-binding protein involved in chromosome partitioning